MNVPLPINPRADAVGLIQAVTSNEAMDKLSCQLSSEQWDTLVRYLQPFALIPGQVLIAQGALDRHVYLIESGTLSVHYEDDKGRVRLAMLGAGAVVGEGTFFSHLPRSASVQAANPVKIWCMTPMRFTELSNRHPAIALQLSMGLGAVLAKRFVNKPKRIAIT